MREILFRGKRVLTGEWVYGLPFGRNDDGLSPMDISGIQSDAGGNIYVTIPETIGQYTGLTDKNGKKIFEGDIVKEPRFVHINNKIEDRSFYYQVKWIDCMLCLTTLKNDADKPCCNILMIDEMEIIGNIHDNPELLKTEE